MNGQGWDGERIWMDGWMGGHGGSGLPLGMGAGSLPTPTVLRGRWGWMQAPKNPTHCPTAKPGATSLPSTVPPAPALQSNIKAEIAT